MFANSFKHKSTNDFNCIAHSKVKQLKKSTVTCRVGFSLLILSTESGILIILCIFVFLVPTNLTES